MSVWGWIATVALILYVVLGLAAHMWIFRDDWKRETVNVLRKVRDGANAVVRWLLAGAVRLAVWAGTTLFLMLMVVVLMLGSVMYAVNIVAVALASVAWWIGLLTKAGRDLVFRLARKNGKGI